MRLLILRPRNFVTSKRAAPPYSRPFFYQKQELKTHAPYWHSLSKDPYLINMLDLDRVVPLISLTLEKVHKVAETVFISLSTVCLSFTHCFNGPKRQHGSLWDNVCGSLLKFCTSKILQTSLIRFGNLPWYIGWAEITASSLLRSIILCTTRAIFVGGTWLQCTRTFRSVLQLCSMLKEFEITYHRCSWQARFGLHLSVHWRFTALSSQSQWKVSALCCHRCSSLHQDNSHICTMSLKHVFWFLCAWKCVFIATLFAFALVI